MINLNALTQRLEWEVSRYTIDFKGIPLPVIKAILKSVKKKYIELGKKVNAAYVQYLLDSLVNGIENIPAKICLHKARGVNDVMYYTIHDILNGIEAAKAALQAA